LSRPFTNIRSLCNLTTNLSNKGLIFYCQKSKAIVAIWVPDIKKASILLYNMKQRGIAIYSTQHRISKLRILADEDKSIFREGTTLGTLCYEGATVP